MLVDLPQELMEQLLEVAEQRKVTVDVVLKDMLEKHLGVKQIDAKDQRSEIQATESEQLLDEVVDDSKQEYPPGSLARFAKLALEASFASKEPVDTSARSREILNSEFADYIDRRIRR